MTLEEWRRNKRVQEVAFGLARVLTEQWVRDRGDGIPVHRLFPQMLEVTTRFLEEKVECIGSRRKQDVAINPYFGQAVAMLLNAMEVVDEVGERQSGHSSLGAAVNAVRGLHTGSIRSRSRSVI